MKFTRLHLDQRTGEVERRAPSLEKLGTLLKVSIFLCSGTLPSYYFHQRIAQYTVGEFCMDEVDDEEVLVDSSPSTTIQLKWIDGSKMKMKVNHSHTVRDILRLLKKRTTTNAPFLLR